MGDLNPTVLSPDSVDTSELVDGAVEEAKMGSSGEVADFVPVSQGDDTVLWGPVPAGGVPAAHAASHTDGSDDIQDATAAQKGVATATQITKLDGIDTGADVTGANAPQAHVASHQNGGSDEMSVAGLSGALADDQPSDHATPIAAHAGVASAHHTRPVTATEGVEGLAEIATGAEVTAKTANDKILTPSNLAVNRFFGYTAASVFAAIANTFQDVDFIVQPVATGITWDDANNEIELPGAGDYLVHVSAGIEKTTGANSTGEFRALLNGVEVAGSAMGRLLDSNNQVGAMSATFMVTAPSAQPLIIQFTGSTTNTRFAPGGINATVTPSVQVTVTRLS